jgi:hypothetical protein
MRLFGFDTHHSDNPLDGASPLDVEMYHMLAHIIANQEKIMSAVDDTAAAVAAEDTVIDGAVTLLKSLTAAVTAAGTDPTKLAALTSDITAKTAVLAAAVIANTPTPVPTSPPVTPAAAATAATAAVAAA